MSFRPVQFILFLITVGQIAFGQVDSTGIDSVATVPYDSVTAVHDSVKRYDVPSSAGSILGPHESDNVISLGEKRWLHYRSLTGILEQYPGVFMRNQYSEGQYDGITVRGNDWRSVAFMMDGRILNDPASGIYNPYYFATEYADRIEIITGPRAFLYGLNSSGGVINLVTANPNLVRPYSVLNYAESGYNYSYSDGTFSQNIGRRFNVLFGFQQQSTDGRFENSESEQWNGRIKLRYSLSEDLHVTLSEYFTHTQTGLNCGIDYALTGFANSFNPRFATVVNADSYEKVTRHDVNLSFIGSLFGDSASISTLTLYYSHNLREYRDEENRPNPNGDFVQWDVPSSWMGGTLRQEFTSEVHHFNAGINIEVRQVDQNLFFESRRDLIWSVWALEELYFEQMKVAGYGRYDNHSDRSFFGYGVDGRVAITPWLKLFAGVSKSYRVPTYNEHYLSHRLPNNPPLSDESHVLAEVGTEFHFPRQTIALSFFHRRINKPIAIGILAENIDHILADNIDQETLSGVDMKVLLRYGWLQMEANGIYFRKGASEVPRLSGTAGLYYRNFLVNGNLELKSGFRGRYLSAYNGATFDPETLAYLSWQGAPIGRGASVDFETTAHIGDAYIQLTWENLASTRYFVTPYYPVLDREVRFGISWRFLD